MGYFYSDEYLQHHGIKGQRWGVRRFQDYNGRRIKNGKPVYSDELLAMYGDVHISRISDHGGLFGSSNQIADISRHALEMGTNKNPYNRTDNCKEVAHAFCESMLNDDPTIAADNSNRFEGNLYDYATEKLNLPIKCIVTAGGNTPNELRDNTIERINIHFEDGDYGMIGIDADHKKFDRLLRAGIITEEEAKITGHAFNWIKEDGQVKFFDCQPNHEPVDATDYFERADLNIGVEFLCYNKAISERGN